MRYVVWLVMLAGISTAGQQLVIRAEPLPGVPIAEPATPEHKSVSADVIPAQEILRHDEPVVPLPPNEKPTARTAGPPEEDGWVNIKTENFEGAFPNEWQLHGTPTWDDETYRHNGGSWSGYCVGSSVSPPGPYPPDAASWMIYGPFSLAGATRADLNFYRWVVTEAGYDYLFWGWSTNGLNFYGQSVSGNLGSWRSQTFDMDTVCGEDSVWIGFYFESDVSDQYEGVYLDDVVLRKYTQSGLADLAPFTPSGWDFPIVPSNIRGTHQVPGQLNASPDTTFIDWAVINQGGAATTQRFYIYLYEDGVPFAGWYVDPPLDPGWYVSIDDHPRLVGSGNHSLMTFADSTNAVPESCETNNRYIRSWTWGGGGGGDYDHVVITAASLASHFNPLCAFIETHLGLNDTVVTVENIYSSFPGRDNPEKIRNFIKHAADNWSTTHILLGGDVSRVPCRYAYGRVNSTTGYLPCDLYYSDLDGTWDADGDNIFGESTDNVDMYPDVYVGRAPVSTTTEAIRFATKFTTYSSDSTDPYLLDVLLGGFDLDASTYGQTTMDFYETNYIPSQMRPCSKVYDTHSGNHRDAVLAHLNAGRHIWLHVDHGNISVLGCGHTNHHWNLYSSDMDALANGTDYTVLVSIACLIGGFDSSDCFTEHFMNAVHGGIAAMTNSRFGWYNPGANPQHTLSALFVEWVVRKLFNHAGNGSLEDFALGKSELVTQARSDMAYRWCMYTFNLFGEPAMNVWMRSQGGVNQERGPSETASGSLLSGPTHFARATRLRLSLPCDGYVSLGIFNQAGRLVRRLTDGQRRAGYVTVVWDGRADDGQLAPPGVYYARVSSLAGTNSLKLVKTRKD